MITPTTGAMILALLAWIILATAALVMWRRAERAKAMRRHPSARAQKLSPDFTSERARRYHGDDSIGR